MNINEPIYEDESGRYQQKTDAGRALSAVGGFIKGAARGAVLGAIGWAIAFTLTPAVAGFAAFAAIAGTMSALYGAYYSHREYVSTGGQGHHRSQPSSAPAISTAGPSPYIYNRDILRDREETRHALEERRRRGNRPQGGRHAERERQRELHGEGGHRR